MKKVSLSVHVLLRHKVLELINDFSGIAQMDSIIMGDWT